MSEVTVCPAQTEAEIEACRELCSEFVDWLLKTYPDKRHFILDYFEPKAYSQTLADLPRIHARPKGMILLGCLRGVPVGCVMYRELQPGVAEVKRLFVSERGRGHGVGRAIIQEMFDRMREDGYQLARFDSAKYLSHARRLYEELGFRETPPPADAPEHVFFMERPL